MRIGGVGRVDRNSRRSGGRERRFRTGERVTARVLRTLAGPLALLDVDGRRLVAWLERDVEPDDELYLEVVSSVPVTRFRRLTGGAAFWSLPVGSVSSDDLDVRA
jgi:hypothetical protein